MSGPVWTAWLAVLTAFLSATDMVAASENASNTSSLTSPLHFAARDDALGRLFGRVGELTLQDGRSLHALLHRLDEADLRFRRILVQQVHVHALRTYSDGSVDVDLFITARDVLLAFDQVRKIVPELRRRHPNDPALRAPGNMLYATGLAFPNSKIIRLPKTPAASTAPAGAADSSIGPPGWRHVSPVDKRLTIEAAKYQAFSKLLHDVGRIRIDAETTVDVLLAGVPGQEDAFRKLLSNAAVYKIDLDPAQVCVAYCDVPADVSARFLAPAVERALLPPEVHSASGLASPPRSGPAVRELVPSWVDDVLTAKGQAARDDVAGAIPGERVAAINADFILARRIDALTWTDGTPLRQRLLRLGPDNGDLRTFFGGKRVLRTHRTDAQVILVVELPLRRLFHLLQNAP